MLSAPTVILKVLVPENYDTFTPIIKYNIMKLLLEMLKSISLYVDFASKYLNAEKFDLLKNLLMEHVARNFPNPELLFKKWDEMQDIPEGFEQYDVLDYLSFAIEISIYYEKLCPRLLDNLLNKVDPATLMMLNDYDGEKRTSVIIKATELFLNLDSNLFLPGRDAFAFVVPLIFKDYFQTKDVLSKDTLKRLFHLSGIFENTIEVDIWIDSIFFSKKLDDTVVNSIVTALNDVYANIMDYTAELNELRSRVEDKNFANVDDILEALSGDVVKRWTKPNLSPFVLGFLRNYISAKYIKNYLNSVMINLLHVQTNPALLINIVKEHESTLLKSTFNYLIQWQMVPVPLENTKNMGLIEKISKGILLGDAEDIDFEDYKINPIYTCVFHMTNLQELKENQMEICLKITKKFMRNNEDEALEIVLNNSILINNFEIFHENEQQKLCTKYVIEIVKDFNSDHYEKLFADLRGKLFASVRRILNEQKPLLNLPEALNAICLDYDHCIHILDVFSAKEPPQQNVNISEIVLYAIKRVHVLCKTRNLKLLEDKVISFISSYLTILNKEDQSDGSFSNAFKEYLTDYPHSIENVSMDLFESILKKKEYCKESASLAQLLLKSSKRFLKPLAENLKNISHTKGLFLPLIGATVLYDDKLLSREIYETFEQTLTKALQKPHKAGTHFDAHYDGLVTLIDEFFPTENCLFYVEKVHKYETTEIFHVNLLCAIFRKALRESFEEKYLNNSILTLTHLAISILKKKGKTENDWNKIRIVTNTFNDYVKEQIGKDLKDFSFKQISDNDTFHLYNKFCLKFGLSGRVYLLNLMETFCSFLDLNDETSNLLLDMILTHSDFLDVILNVKVGKTEVSSLIFILCKRWPNIMQKNHVPILLAAYTATWKRSDRIILRLLKL